LSAACTAVPAASARINATAANFIKDLKNMGYLLCG
jgi:hypothetical protein